MRRRRRRRRRSGSDETSLILHLLCSSLSNPICPIGKVEIIWETEENRGVAFGSLAFEGSRRQFEPRRAFERIIKGRRFMSPLLNHTRWRQERLGSRR